MLARPTETPRNSFPDPIQNRSRLSVNRPFNFRQVFRIGEVSFALNGNSANDVRGDSELAQFAARDSDPNIEVNVLWVDSLRPQSAESAFDSGATWRMLRCDDGLLFEFTSPVLEAAPYKTLCVDSSFRKAELTLSRDALRHCPEISPVEYPVCELLITNYLAWRGAGVEVHGCGLVDSQTGGHLFLGHSGAGKSTTARLWQSLRDPEILSDDRLILRLHDGELWMHGTPWHGEAAFALPKKSRLNKIHILQHGVKNKFSVVPAGRALAEIFARSFPPFHSSQAVERTLEFLKNVVDLVPCYQFEFVPDSSAVAAVLGFHSAQMNNE